MIKTNCPKCGGYLMFEVGTEDFSCVNCGWRRLRDHGAMLNRTKVPVVDFTNARRKYDRQNK
jgi:tRNA(Ile2) C34 agmatinyltransferase TiaS